MVVSKRLKMISVLVRAALKNEPTGRLAYFVKAYCLYFPYLA